MSRSDRGCQLSLGNLNGRKMSVNSRDIGWIRAGACAGQLPGRGASHVLRLASCFKTWQSRWISEEGAEHRAGGRCRCLLWLPVTARDCQLGTLAGTAGSADPKNKVSFTFNRSFSKLAQKPPWAPRSICQSRASALSRILVHNLPRVAAVRLSDRLARIPQRRLPSTRADWPLAGIRNRFKRRSTNTLVNHPLLTTLSNSWLTDQLLAGGRVTSRGSNHRRLLC